MKFCRSIFESDFLIENSNNLFVTIVSLFYYFISSKTILYFSYFMFYYLILVILPFTFEQLFDNQTHQYPCFCNCCASKPCSLEIQKNISYVFMCETCEISCRTQFSACQLNHDQEKIFALCSTNVDKQGQLGENDYIIVKAADALLATNENKTILQYQLEELRKSYDEKVKNGTTDDHRPNGEHYVQVCKRSYRCVPLVLISFIYF